MNHPPSTSYPISHRKSIAEHFPSIHIPSSICLRYPIHDIYRDSFHREDYRKIIAQKEEDMAKVLLRSMNESHKAIAICSSHHNAWGLLTTGGDVLSSLNHHRARLSRLELNTVPPHCHHLRFTNTPNFLVMTLEGIRRGRECGWL